jgi:hypothetical protein
MEIVSKQTYKTPLPILHSGPAATTTITDKAAKALVNGT